MVSNIDIQPEHEQPKDDLYMMRKETIIVNSQTLQAAQVAVKALFYILTHSKDDSLNGECKQMINTLCEKFSVPDQEAESISSSD
jgi:hypothetical protein